MGLRMKDRQSLTRKIVPRYQKARKVEKEKILDEFVKNTGYSRNYAIHILATWGEVHTLVIDEKPIRVVVGVSRTRKKRKENVHYTISPATIDRLLKVERKKLEIKGRSHTKGGVLLKHQIPISTFYDWYERKPGFFTRGS